MSYNLFLDDERWPNQVTWVNIGPGPWVIVRHQSEFETIISDRGIPDKISFDNDLGEGCGEGRFCAQWLIDAILDDKLALKPFTFTVHSMNPIAKQTIESKLNQFLSLYA